MKCKAFVAAAIAVAGLFGGFSVETAKAQAVTVTETLITTDDATQVSPAIYENHTVWVGSRSGYDDIYMYDLFTGEETRLTTDGASGHAPAIHGNRIVWQDYRNGNSDIYMYDLSTNRETPITTNPADQVSPAIYGDRIVWVDDRIGGRGSQNCDIFMHDVSTGTETQIRTRRSWRRYATFCCKSQLHHKAMSPPTLQAVE